MLKNWLSQPLQVGTPVYRGARDGNSSSFKVGRIVKVDDVKNTVRVHWLYEQGGLYWYHNEVLPIEDFGGFEPVRRLDSQGSPDINSLCVISEETMSDLEWNATRTEQYKEEVDRLRSVSPPY